MKRVEKGNWLKYSAPSKAGPGRRWRTGTVVDIMTFKGRKYYVVRNETTKKKHVIPADADFSVMDVYPYRTNPAKRRSNPYPFGKRFVHVMVPPGSKRIYSEVQRIWCRKGKDSHYPGKNFEHTFRTKPELWGLPDGSLLIVSKSGKRLWGEYRA